MTAHELWQALAMIDGLGWLALVALALLLRAFAREVWSREP